MRLLHVPSPKPLPFHQSSPDPLCSICTKPVLLEKSKTDEHGLAVHEECYVLKLQLHPATTEMLNNVGAKPSENPLIDS